MLQRAMEVTRSIEERWEGCRPGEGEPGCLYPTRTLGRPWTNLCVTNVQSTVKKALQRHGTLWTLLRDHGTYGDSGDIWADLFPHGLSTTPRQHSAQMSLLLTHGTCWNDVGQRGTCWDSENLHLAVPSVFTTDPRQISKKKTCHTVWTTGRPRGARLGYFNTGRGKSYTPW